MAGMKIVDGVDRGLREVAEELAPYGWASSRRSARAAAAATLVVL
jgi:hypothetical protein